MSLGNNTGMGQVRGKNKPILIKRIKEVVAAKDYKKFSCSPPGFYRAVGDACSINTASGLTEEYYHSGARPTPRAGDRVYTRKRAFKKYYLRAGYYKTTDGIAKVAFEVDRTGTVGNITLCKS